MARAFGALVAALGCEPRPTPHVDAASAVVPVPADVATPTTCVDHGALDPTTLPPLPETPYTATLEQVWEIVRTKHFDPTLGCLDWPAIRLETGAAVAAAPDAAAAYAAMNAMLGRLGQSHFRVMPPGDAGAEEARGPASAPIAIRLIEGRAIVVDDAVGGRASGVPRGAEVIAVDDRPVSVLIDEVSARGPRPSELAFEVSQALRRWLAGAEGERRRVRFRDPARRGEEREVEVACALPVGESVSLGNLRDIPTRVEWRMIAGTKVGYLAFNYWMLPMVQRVAAGLAELQAAGMEALIIDLRGNPGGVGAMSVPVARLLLREDGSLGTLRFRDFKQEFQVVGEPTAFAGELVILVDEGTASTSEIFAAGLRDLGRARVVGGRASAGAALPSLIERLDGGAVLQYVVGDYHSSKGSAAEGDGVVPDLRVQETQDDFIAGRDPVLDAAVRLLTER